MAHDLAPKRDGSPYAASEVWAAVEFVVPVIEICGRRSSAECLAAQVAAAALLPACMLLPSCPPACSCPHVYLFTYLHVYVCFYMFTYVYMFTSKCLRKHVCVARLMMACCLSLSLSLSLSRARARARSLTGHGLKLYEQPRRHVPHPPGHAGPCACG